MRDSKRQLQELNERFAGKKIKHCKILGTMINFGYESLTFCCSSTLKTGSPSVCGVEDVINGELDKDYFISRLVDTMYQNQEKGACTGCKHLQEMDFDGLDYNTMQLDHIVYNNFLGCNSSCVYCSQNETKIHEKYPVYDLVKKLYREGFIAEHMQIDFGGGEPTMLPNLAHYLKFGIEHKMKQLINTSGILFSQDIYDGLTQGLVGGGGLIVQVSPDSGSRETYKRIKRRDRFNVVWDNIGRYCDFPGQVLVKYIVFSWNSSRTDLDGFIESCKEYGVKNVVVSGESWLTWNFGSEEREWTFGSQEEDACAYLMDKCLENQIAVSLSSGNFSEDSEKKVISKFASYLRKRYAESGGDIYIFGMGSNGKKVCDSLTENGIMVRGFLDNDLIKQKEKYRTLPCFNPKEVEKDAQIVITNTNYAAVFQAMKEYGYKKISVFHF